MENSQCLNCQHYDENREGHFCSAFPKGNGIPQSIWTDEVKHNSHVPGQVGDYTYTPKQAEERRKAG